MMAEEARVPQFVENEFDRPIQRFCTFHGDRGVGCGGKNKSIGHGTRGALKLLANGGFGAAALANVPMDATGEADGVWRVDEDRTVKESAQGGVVKGEDAFHEDDGSGLDALGVAADAGVSAEVIDGAVDGDPSEERGEVLDEQIDLKRVRVIEVERGTGVR